MKRKQKKQSEKSIINKNKKIIRKYPFLMIREDYFNGTLLDLIPIGWSKLMLKLSKKIIKILNKSGCTILDFYINDIKEKWGVLDINFSAPEKVFSEIDNLIDEYSKKSEEICQVCGKKAVYATTGWIGYFCKKHIKDINSSYVNIKDFNNI